MTKEGTQGLSWEETKNAYKIAQMAILATLIDESEEKNFLATKILTNGKTDVEAGLGFHQDYINGYWSEKENFGFLPPEQAIITIACLQIDEQCSGFTSAKNKDTEEIVSCRLQPGEIMVIHETAKPPIFHGRFYENGRADYYDHLNDPGMRETWHAAAILYKNQEIHSSV